MNFLHEKELLNQSNLVLDKKNKIRKLRSR
jgi:hypothetical protein